MKRLVLCHLFVLACLFLMGQTITMCGTAACSTSTTSCSGTFLDPGGAGAYANTVGTFTQTICASSGTEILHVTISSLNLDQGGGPSNNDDFRVYLGTSTAGILIYDAPEDVIATDLDFYSIEGGCLTFVFIQAGTNNGSAPGWTGTLECLNTAITPITSATNIVTSGTYFTDPGGLAGNMDGGIASGASCSLPQATGYVSSSENYYTICPSVPGTFVTINFLEFNVTPGLSFAEMVILDGGVSGGIIGSYTGTTLPPSITSSSPDGCLTLWFNSATYCSAGWLALITTGATRGSNIYCCTDYECSGGCGNWICVSGEFEPNTGGGIGCVEDLRDPETRSCSSNGEVNSTWYYFSPVTSGTLGFDIVPPNGLDFDYAIWKSYSIGQIECPLNTDNPPIRCSYAAANGPVGLNFTSGDLFEGAGGDNYTRYMDVLAGETYMMMLNTFSPGSPQANPTWTWTGTAVLDCTPVNGVLEADFLDFYGRPAGSGLELIWRTGSEISSSHFEVLRGSQPDALTAIGQRPANLAPSRYSFLDDRLATGTYYYQIVEYDVAGRGTSTEVIEIHYEVEKEPAELIKIVNLLGVDVTQNPPRNQVLIKMYSDGSSEKFVSND